MYEFDLARDWPLIAAGACLALSLALSVRDRIRRVRRDRNEAIRQVTS